MGRKHILAAAGLMLVATIGRAQDAQLSQYDAASILLNPALTGMYEDNDLRASSNLRDQWGRLGSNYITAAFAVDASFERQFGVGAYFENYNMAGVMNTFRSGFTGAYNVSSGRAKHTLSVGVNVGVIYKKVNEDRLTWDAQYDRDHFNTDLPSGEFFRRGSRLMPDLGIGVAYRSLDRNRMVNPFANFALFHVTAPDESIFREQRSRLPIRYSVNAGAYIEVDYGIHVIPQALYLRQGADQQIQAGAMGKVDLMNGVYSVLAGASYRWNDAVIAQVGLKHGQNMYRFSYDLNVSPLKRYTHLNGAFEFSVVYFGTFSGRNKRTVSSAF